MPLFKSVGVANQQSPATPRKFVALYHRNSKIRMRSDERDKLNFKDGIHQENELFNCQWTKTLYQYDLKHYINFHSFRELQMKLVL